MKKSSLFILLTVSVLQSVFAQDADTSSKKSAPVVITGSIDGYYRYNFNNPKDPPYNNLTSFTRSHNSFELGMASIRADHSFGKVSATIDLGFGARAESFSYNDAGTRFAIKQAYISYAPWQAVKFTFGTWATHIGYEMADAYLNRNYSMSYMFTNGPFTHTGLKADISLGGKTAMMIGISNPTDFRTAPGMPKSVIAQFSTGTKDDKFKAYLNLVAGKQSDFKKLVQPDLVALYAISPEFSIGFNGTLQEVKLDADSTGRFSNYQWWGTALYLNVDPLTWFGLTLRGEYIGDRGGYLGLNHAFAPTVSANFKISNLTIIPEFRFDNTGNRIFRTADGATAASSGSFLVAATCHF